MMIHKVTFSLHANITQRIYTLLMQHAIFMATKRNHCARNAARSDLRKRGPSTDLDTFDGHQLRLFDKSRRR
jgi:hypothetical protein